MNMALGLYQRQETKYIGLPKTTKAAKDLHLTELLEKVYDRKYSTWQDWVLCVCFPLYSDECFAYYKGKGPGFLKLHREVAVSVDRLIARQLKERAMKLIACCYYGEER